jgi:hypothetical protein
VLRGGKGEKEKGGARGVNNIPGNILSPGRDGEGMEGEAGAR